MLLASAGSAASTPGEWVCVPPWLAATALVLLTGAGGVSAIERIQDRRSRRP